MSDGHSTGALVAVAIAALVVGILWASYGLHGIALWVVGLAALWLVYWLLMQAVFLPYRVWRWWRHDEPFRQEL